MLRNPVRESLFFQGAQHVRDAGLVFAGIPPTIGRLVQGRPDLFKSQHDEAVAQERKRRGAQHTFFAPARRFTQAQF